jgi:hypothetical protein
MPQQSKSNSSVTCDQREGRALPELAALVENRDFRADCQLYYHNRFFKAKGAENNEEWMTHGQPLFMSTVLNAFIDKWGANPLPVALLRSLGHYKKYYATVNGRWGLIPVYPWTTKQEIEHHARQIHRMIGKSHQDFMEDRRVQIAKWLSSHVSLRTGSPPRYSDIAAVVWGRTKGLKRLSKERGVARLSFDREQALMERYMAKGKTYREAERLVHHQARGKEAPASAMVRMALRRLKREQAKLENHKINPAKSDKLGLALTMLLRELHPLTPDPDLKRVHAKAVALANLLTGS